jgi:hypothetical protein
MLSATKMQANLCICLQVGKEHEHHQRDTQRKHPTSRSKHRTLQHKNQQIADKKEFQK